ncbi:helix-turn-helix domain-containing protein [Streptomyces sp. NBC_01518]|uniref:helix-turn-helix domain-containing protein n=1 Tax=Streptomyces sp. NBC_01518 TaxID=2903891 RepID=UPI0038642874
MSPSGTSDITRDLAGDGENPHQGSTDYEDLSGTSAGDREAGLEDLISRTHVGMSMRLSPDRPRAAFQAWVRRREIEDLLLVEAGSDPCSGMRGARRAARTSSLYLGVMVTRQGRETVLLDDVAADLRPGDVVVWRSDRRARMEVHEQLTKQTLIIPRSALDEVAGGGDLFQTAVLDSRAPATQLLTGYLDLLARTVSRLNAVELAAARKAALELFAATARRPGSPSAGWRATTPPLAVLAAWIDNQLPAGDVRPARIAAAHGVSVRTLYRIFEEAGETVSAFVRARRLAGARRDLAARSDWIADVAVRWGFFDASHFSRAFRSQYGVAPSEYRRSAAVGPHGPVGVPRS